MCRDLCSVAWPEPSSPSWGQSGQGDPGCREADEGTGGSDGRGAAERETRGRRGGHVEGGEASLSSLSSSFLVCFHGEALSLLQPGRYM